MTVDAALHRLLSAAAAARPSPEPKRSGDDLAPVELCATTFSTALGPMAAVAHPGGLVVLDFFDRRGLPGALARLTARAGRPIPPGWLPLFDRLGDELDAYFSGRSAQFTVVAVAPGTPFQRALWRELGRIAPGTTRTYEEMAGALGKPSGARAVGSANGANTVAIVVPCHRLIGSDGSLVGYGGGLGRKRWLLRHERVRFGAQAAGSTQPDVHVSRAPQPTPHRRN